MALFRGGMFLFEGTTFNGALFRSMFQDSPLAAEGNVTQMRFSKDKLVVYSDVHFSSGHCMRMSYSATLMKPIGRTFVQVIDELELPSPLGKRRPIVHNHERIEVSYIDDQLLVLRDHLGNFEVLMRT